MNDTIYLDRMGFSAPTVTASGVIINFDSSRIEGCQSAYYNGFSDDVRHMLHELKDEPKNIVGVIKITDKGFVLIKAWQNGIDGISEAKQNKSEADYAVRNEINLHWKKNTRRIKELEAKALEAEKAITKLYSVATQTVSAIVNDINAKHFS